MKVLKFYGDWCRPCSTLTGTLKEMNLSVSVEEIDVDRHPDVATKHGVRGVPTLIRLDDEGKETARLVGAKPRDVLEAFFS